MWTDPIVEETRRAREELAARFGHDVDALCRYLRERDRADPRPMIERAPKPPATVEPVSRKAS